jgi:hypothetical protein
MALLNLGLKSILSSEDTMHKIEDVKVATPFLTHDGKGGNPHYGIVQPGQVMFTGQTILEDVKTQNEWIAKAVELGYASEAKEDHGLIPKKEKERMGYQDIAIEAKKRADEKAKQK